MQVSFHIICTDADVSRIENCLKEMSSAKSQAEIVPYWKISGCSEITCEYPDIFIDAENLREVVRKIGGSGDLICSQQDDCEEYSIYTPIEKITSGDCCAFVVCFVNTKEDTK